MGLPGLLPSNPNKAIQFALTSDAAQVSSGHERDPGEASSQLCKDRQAS
ncbi:MAG: hypothetical protein PHY05_09490 [Methanothrix sp.]|nr:hypothetical protein [Methanothrix sp.]